MCKGTNLPASNIASIDVPFRGRTLKVAGDRTVDNWSVTVINDENFNLRTKFEVWMDAIAQMSNNSGATEPTSYMGDAEVRQLGRGYGKGKESKNPEVMVVKDHSEYILSTQSSCKRIINRSFLRFFRYN